jgi:hypothetical protein
VKKKVLLTISAILIVGGCGPGGPVDTVDTSAYNTFQTVYKKGNVVIMADKDTGCQYVYTGDSRSSFTPRLTAEGVPMCGK